MGDGECAGWAVLMSDTYAFGAQTPHGLDRPFQRPDRLHDPLYVVTPVFNAARFRSRWRLYADFKKMVAESGAILYTVEVAFGDRDFVVTTPDDPYSIQLRTNFELFIKENAINVAVGRLPLGWKKVAWVDADVHFARYDWADETRHLLERYPVVQMWSQLHDLNAEHELVGTNKSFGAVWVERGGVIGGNPDDPPYNSCQPYSNSGKPGFVYPGAPGLAWAMVREAWDAYSGLIDYSILGASDWHMAHCLTGQCEKSVGHVKYGNARFADMVREWQHRGAAARWKGRPIMGNLGVMRGVASHYWHGPKVNRLYGTREQILARNEFNPDLDLKRDWQGLYQLTDRNPQMLRDIQGYWDQRNEDALT